MSSFESIPDCVHYSSTMASSRKTGDKLPLRCRFHSNTYSTVVKASK